MEKLTKLTYTSHIHSQSRSRSEMKMKKQYIAKGVFDPQTANQNVIFRIASDLLPSLHLFHFNEFYCGEQKKTVVIPTASSGS